MRGNLSHLNLTNNKSAERSDSRFTLSGDLGYCDTADESVTGILGNVISGSDILTEPNVSLASTLTQYPESEGLLTNTNYASTSDLFGDGSDLGLWDFETNVSPYYGWNDLSTNANHFYYQTGYAFGDGVPELGDRSMWLYNGADWAVATDLTWLGDPDSDLTFSVWVYFDASRSEDMFIFANHQTVDLTVGMAWFQITPTYVRYAIIAGVNVETYYNVYTSIPDKVWTNVIIRKTGRDFDVKVAGEHRGTMNANYTYSTTPTQYTRTTIGRRIRYNITNLAGNLRFDQIRMFDKYVSDEESKLLVREIKDNFLESNMATVERTTDVLADVPCAVPTFTHSFSSDNSNDTITLTITPSVPCKEITIIGYTYGVVLTNNSNPAGIFEMTIDAKSLDAEFTIRLKSEDDYISTSSINQQFNAMVYINSNNGGGSGWYYDKDLELEFTETFDGLQYSWSSTMDLVDDPLASDGKAAYFAGTIRSLMAKALPFEYESFRLSMRARINGWMNLGAGSYNAWNEAGWYNENTFAQTEVDGQYSKSKTYFNTNAEYHDYDVFVTKIIGTTKHLVIHYIDGVQKWVSIYQTDTSFNKAAMYPYVWGTGWLDTVKIYREV